MRFILDLLPCGVVAVVVWWYLMIQTSLCAAATFHSLLN